MLKRIVLPIDVREPQLWANSANVAFNLAQQSGATVHVLFVAPKLEHNLNRMPEDYRPKLEQWAKDHVPSEVDAKTHLKAGSAHREICTTAREVGADVVVMGSHNPEFKDMLLGSNASSVVLHAPCSVYVVR